MKKSITLETINEIIPYERNLYSQERLASLIGERQMGLREMLEKEIAELDFHVSRFACEGASLRQINQYRVLVDYVNVLYKDENYYKCAKVSTILKIFLGLDISFFSLLPELKKEIESRGPIYFQTLVNTARRNVKDPSDSAKRR